MSDEESMTSIPWSVASTFVSEETAYNSYNGSSCCLPELKDRTHFAMHHMLESFVKSNCPTMALPPGLSSLQKNYILTIIQCMGLAVESKSDTGMNIVECVKTHPALRFVRQLIMGEDTFRFLRALLSWCENETLLSGRTRIDLSMPFIYTAVGVLTYGNPRVPKPAKSSEFKDHRSNLPIFNYREEILGAIQKNTFLLIKGPAGCGKTTQIPQYILEEAELKKKPVRILVCLPRRVGAIAVCDRVAAERGEKVGHTVGYQIRLESCTSPVETLLNFCTGSVLFRAMTVPGCPLLDDTTHIILDEIHCRERYQDFLLNCLRDFALTKPYLKFIFVGEDPNMDFVSEYFGGIQKCPQFVVEGGPSAVKTVYLEELLRYSWESVSQNGSAVQTISHAMHTFGETVGAEQKYKNAEIYNVDELIEKVWTKDAKTSECLEDFVYMVRQDVIDVNYVHSNTSLSMLMAAAATGRLNYVELLLDAGADMTLKSNNDFTAREWANHLGNTDVVKALDLKARSRDVRCHPNSKKCIVEDYFGKPLANKVDFGIILGLVHMIHVTDKSGGSILIFLPSYEDLNLLKERICLSCRNDPGWNANPFVIHFLHAHIQTGDQRSVFEKPTSGLRKIILSTDIGQSCLTFEDVGFVIDCGKAKEDAHHVLVGTAEANANLFKGWISKAEANQRRDRAGRCGAGVCFRLYSKKIFEDEMRDFIIPEILRIPLLNLCLQSRALLRPEVRIADFFECLPTPPHKMDILNAIETLKLMSVLNENEQLTILGVHLLDYSIDPHWAKALLYSVIFKCMDPVLTIASYVSYGNAFVYQYDPKLRHIAHSRKLTLSDGTLSDHMAILKVFHKWESERALREGNIVEFCENYFVTSSTFDVLYGIRTRLLGQLRASGFVRNKGSLDVKDLNMNADNWAVVKAVLVAALYPNVCTVDRINKNMLDRESDELKLHPSSVLAIQELDWQKNLPSDWILFNEKCYDLTRKVLVKGCTVVNALTVALMAGNLGSKPTSVSLPMAPVVSGVGFHFTSSDRDNCNLEKIKARIVIDNWISVFSFNHKLLDIVPLREHIYDMILRRLKRPELFLTEVDHRILDTVVDVLSREDFRIGLKQSSVGQWPKLVAGNLLSAPRTGFEMTN